MKVTANLADAGAAARVLSGKLSLAARVRADRIGREMVQIANRKMASQFDLNRPGSRRRHPGSARAANALDHQLYGAELPFEIRYRVKGGEDVLARIIFMNYGTSPHPIRPSGNWPLRRSAIPRKLAWDENGELIVANEVQHPGQRATNFLQEARDEAVALHTD